MIGNLTTSNNATAYIALVLTFLNNVLEHPTLSFQEKQRELVNKEDEQVKFRISGIPDPDALELKRKEQPIGFAKRSPLRRLNFLLGLIKKHHPEDLANYVSNLQRRYEGLVESNLVEERDIDISTLIAEFDLLMDFPGLALSNLNYFLQTLQPPESADWTNDTIEVPQRSQLRALLCPKYQNLLVLTETIDRGEAIELYKIYHDEFVRSVSSTHEDRYETLEELSARWTNEDTIGNHGLIRVISDVKDGKIFLRKDTCLWDDALEDLEDQKLKYYVCCYGDFDAIKRDNKHFVLTMKHTIIEGHPYCDCVIHDTRIDSDLSHPSDEFFARIVPE